MNANRQVNRIGWVACVFAGLALGFSAELPAEDPRPEVSSEGLQLQKDTKTRVVYLRPGASFAQYNRVAILDCFVEFAKDWQRDYNRNVAGTQNRVSTDDMERIKTAVAAEFKKIFTEELQNKGGYQVVDVAAPDVLVLRPAIVNLVVTAPDLMTANMGRTIVDSAGQMTLYLELWDSADSEILARIMDAKADRGFGGRGQTANRVTNNAAADLILRSWAEELRKHLDAVRGPSAGN
jgi:hypothetical protein